MSKFDKLVQGNVLSETAFYKVEKVVGNKVQLQMDNGESVVLDKGYVDSFLTSAEQFSKEEKVSKTELTEIFLSYPRTAITVNFNKQVKEADVAKEIQEAYENSNPKEFSAKMKQAVKKGLAGEARTMVGRHFGTQDEFGRVQFIDMSLDRDFSKPTYDSRQRQVDTRTLNWAIINDVKYIVK